MTESFSERIENSLNDIQKIQLLFRKRYGEECLADKEIEEVLKIAKAEHEEIQQYRAIGTVKECWEAMERQGAKKPYLYGGTRQGLDNDGNSISKEENCYECPTCDQFLGYEIDCKDEHHQVDYCPYCGQAIDWSDTD